MGTRRSTGFLDAHDTHTRHARTLARIARFCNDNTTLVSTNGESCEFWYAFLKDLGTVRDFCDFAISENRIDFSDKSKVTGPFFGR